MNNTAAPHPVWVVPTILLTLLVMLSSCTDVRGPYTDGTYQGTARGYYGDLTVEVEIQGGNISLIDVLKSEDTDGILSGVVNVVIPDIIKANKIEGVDTLSGATSSSKGVLQAVEIALTLATVR